MADGIVKVRRTRATSATGAAGDDEPASPAVVFGAADRTAADDAVCEPWTEREGRLVARAGALVVEVDPASALVTFRDVGSSVLLAEAAAHVAADDGDAAEHLLACRMGPTEQFYGLGQKVRGADDTSLGWRGRVRAFGPFGNVREKSCPGVAGQGNGNTTIPLLLSSAGFGLFLDNHYRHGWDFTADDRWTVTAAAGEHRYWLCYGPDAAGVLQRYTRLTGRPPLPPKWALGLLQSKFGYRSWDEVDEVARRYRASGIPCDAIILDLHWFGGVPHFGGAHRIGALEWDATHFADARRRIARLRAQGFRTIVIEEPYVDAALPAFDEAARAGHLATSATPDGTAPTVLEKWWGRGGIVDMTSPDARAWWWRRHLPLVADGVAGWWTDLGEPDTFDAESRYAGGAHADVHNLYAMEWARALVEGAARDLPDERPFVLTRAGYAGIQRHGAALWSNDVMTAFEWLAPQVATGLNVGLSGIPWWGTDVGGFIGPVASDELYCRWFQFGALSPVFRPHGQERPTAPFEFSPETEAICRRFAELRYRLLPYLYTAAREAHDTGLPLMRPLLLDDPDDAVAPDLGHEYLLGPSLLVAPVLHAGTTRNVYLPRGAWVDFWTGETYHGPTWLRNFPAPLDTVPLFVRRGAVLPLAFVAPHTEAQPEDELAVRVYPGPAGSAPTSYVLYEDDGHTNDYREGASSRTTVTVTPAPDGFAVEIAPPEGWYAGRPTSRRWYVEAPLAERPDEVRWNGEVLVEGSWDAHVPTWWWDPATRLLHVRARRLPTGREHRFEVRC
ncbi:MAG TPA: TIM-barrel domain-containing protein [Gemmatimonadales bacterium]|nr:TIM-barrel domain-containing protein [Gemmatimonadales bacterium]